MLIKLTKPIDDMDRWTRGMDRLMNSMFLYETRTAPSTWRPPTDVYETADMVVIKVEIAGMSADDFEISFADRILQIRGTRLDKERKVSYHCLEVQYGEFLSEVYLPGKYDEENFEAEYENGFLVINLPKAPPESPKIIGVRSNEE
jgi:HSP20 family protein